MTHTRLSHDPSRSRFRTLALRAVAVAPRRARAPIADRGFGARASRRARRRVARPARATGARIGTMVFERLLADQLNARLGSVLEGVDRDDVRVGVMSGDVRIRRVRVRASALTKMLGEPSARVRCGFVDELRVRVPWRNLGKEAVRVTFRGVYVVGEIDVNGDDGSGESEEARRERQRVKALKTARRAADAAERAWLKWNPAVNAEALEAEDAKEIAHDGVRKRSAIAGLIDVALANVLIEISNVHVRIEGEYGAGVPCGMGLVLERVSLTGEDFKVGGFADSLRKMIALERVGVYADFNSPSVASKTPGGWRGIREDQFVRQMSAVFNTEVGERMKEGTSGDLVIPQSYVFGPLRGTATYARRGHAEDTNTPLHQLRMDISSIQISIKSTQLKVLYSMYSDLRTSRVRYTYAHIRPRVGVKGNALLWWRFAGAGVQMHVDEIRKRRGLDFKSSVHAMVRITEARQRYIPLYVEHLRSAPPPPECLIAERAERRNKLWPPKLKIGMSTEIDEIEGSIPLQSIITFRTLAHVEYRESGGVKAAVARERAARFGKRRIVRAVVGLAGGGAKNTAMVLRGLSAPIRGFARAVNKRDSTAVLVERQKRLRKSQPEEDDDSNWRESLENTVQLSERMVALEEEAAHSSVEISGIVNVENVLVCMVDDEVDNPIGEQEIFRIGIYQVSLGTLRGSGRQEQRVSIRRLAIVSPEGTLMDSRTTTDNEERATSLGRSQVALWDKASECNAMQLQIVKGDVETEEDIFIKFQVRQSVVHLLREPLDRVARVAVRHKVTTAYLESFIYDDEAKQRNHTQSIEKQADEFKIKPRVRLDAQVHGPVIILDGDGVNLRVDLGTTVIESMTPVSAGIESSLAKEHNVFSLQCTGFQVGFIDDEWDTDSNRPVEDEQVILPLLSAPSSNTVVIQNLNTASDAPNLTVRSKFSAIDVSFSPARVFKIRSLVKALKPTTSVSEEHVAAVVIENEVRVLLLQLDESGEVHWIPATMSLQNDSSMDIRTIDGLKSRTIHINLMESNGASKLRSDICTKLSLHKDVLTIGETVHSLDELMISAMSDDSLSVMFDIDGDDARSRDDTVLFDAWYARINGVARENITRLTNAGKSGKLSKTQVILSVGAEKLSVHVFAPLKAHPSEDDSAVINYESDSERALASLCLDEFNYDSALARTVKVHHIKAKSLVLYDRYASEGIGRECIAGIGGQGSGQPLLTVTATVRHQSDPQYCGLDKLIEIDVHKELVLNIRRPTLLTLISLRFRLRPPGFKIIKIMPDVSSRIMISGKLVKRIKREIRVNVAAVTANGFYDHNKEIDLPVLVLRVEDCYWGTIISPPTRETSVSVGTIKLATGQMQARGAWNLQPSPESNSNIILLHNNVYDRGEELDGADESWEIELGNLDIVMTPEMKEIGSWFAFFGQLRPDHIEKYVHPCARPRAGFKRLKSRLSIKMDDQRITLPVALSEGEENHDVVINSGCVEITRAFSSKAINEAHSIFWQTTALSVSEFEVSVISFAEKRRESVSKITQKPLGVKLSLRKRIDSGPTIVNELDDKNKIRVQPIFLDLSGSEFRCIHDSIKNIQSSKVRPNVKVENPIRWGNVEPLPVSDVLAPVSLKSMELSFILSSAKLRVFRLPTQSRPLSTIKVVGVDVFVVKNLNRKSGINLDATVDMIGVDDNSNQSQNLQVKHVLYAGSPKLPLLHLTLGVNDDSTRLRVSLQHVELLLRVGIILDTIRTFAPRKLGGVFLASMILPQDIKCVHGTDFHLDKDVTLTNSMRLLADDPKIVAGKYVLRGGGHTIKFADGKGAIIRHHSHGSRRKTMPRIIIGHGAMLKIENVTFNCTRSTLSRFIKIMPGGSYSLGKSVSFDETEEDLIPVHDGLVESTPVIDAATKRAEEGPGRRMKEIKKKPLLVEVDVSCVHIVIGEEPRADQINLMFGVDVAIIRDEELNTTATYQLLRLRTKDTMKPPLLEPASVTLHVASHDGGVTTCTGSVTPIKMQLSPNRICILKNFTERIGRSFAIAPILQTGVYSCVWEGHSPTLTTNVTEAGVLRQNRAGSNTSYSIWRPVAPPGYAILADVVKSEGGAPETQVLIVRDAPALCAIPVRFEKVEGTANPCLWRPLAPKGFVSLGDIASVSDEDVPSLDIVRCIREELVTNIGQASTLANFRLYGDFSQSNTTLWQMNNRVRGFVAVSNSNIRPHAYDIRSPPGFQNKVSTGTKEKIKLQEKECECATAVNFKKIGMAQNAESTVGFWEVIPPTGYVSTGHCMSIGKLPPLSSRVFADDKSTFRQPESYEKVASARTYGTTQRLTIWKPVPCAGFVSVGFVVTTEDNEPSVNHSIVCVRQELVSYMHQRNWTTDNSVWTVGENSADTTHFWITNDHTKNFVMSVLTTGMAPDFGFDIGFLENSSLRGRVQMPNFIMKFDAPLVSIGLSFERLFRNQTLFLLRLENTKLSCTKTSKLNLSLDSSLSLLHRNARLGYSLEPIVAPWKFSFLLDDSKNDVSGVNPAGLDVFIESKKKIEIIVNQASIVDAVDAVMQFKKPRDENSKIAHLLAYEAVQNNVVVNSTGRDLWVRELNGNIQQVPPGNSISHLVRAAEIEANSGFESEANKQAMRGMTDVVDDINHHGDEQLVIAHLMLDIVAMDSLDDWLYPRITFKIWDEALQSHRTDPLPIGVMRGSAKLPIPHPLFHRDGIDGEFINNDDITVIVEISHIGPNGETLSVSGDFEAPIEQQRDGWVGGKTGSWIECTAGDGDPVRIKLRARVVEGLNATPIIETVESYRLLHSPQKSINTRKLQVESPPLIVCRTNDMVKQWWTTDHRRSKSALSAWKPHVPSTYELETRYKFCSSRAKNEYKLVPFGTILLPGLIAPRSALMAVVFEHNSDQRAPTAFPMGFENIWTSDKNDVSFWKPVAPDGYVAIGNVVAASAEMPSTDCVVCVREDLTKLADVPPDVAWKSHRRFRNNDQGNLALIQNGQLSTGGWSFLKEKIKRTSPGVISNVIPSMYRLNDRLCIHSLDEESIREFWIDTRTHTDHMKEDLQAGESILAISFSPSGPFEQVRLNVGASHVVRHKTHDLVFDSQKGHLLSYVSCENETDSEIFVDVHPAMKRELTSSNLNMSSLSEADESPSDVVDVEVFESERYYPLKGWSAPKDAIIKARYSRHRNGRGSQKRFPYVKAPKGFRFEGPWELDKPPNRVNDDGWAYGAIWLTKWPPPRGSDKSKGRATRRRRWFRRVVRLKSAEEIGSRVSLHNMKRDFIEDWHGALAIHGRLTLPACSRTESYMLSLRTGADVSSITAPSFAVRDDLLDIRDVLSEQGNCVLAYNNLHDHFLLFKEELSNNVQSSAIGAVPGVKIRVVAPLHVVSLMDCPSQLVLYVNGEEKIAMHLAANETKRITAIDTNCDTLEVLVSLFEDYLSLSHNRPLRLNVTPAGSPPAPQVNWLNIKGYPHVVSMMLMEACRTRMAGDKFDDDPSQHLLSLTYRNVLMVTNASPIDIKCLAWVAGTSTTSEHTDAYVGIPRGESQPAMFLKSSAKTLEKVSSKEFLLGVCIDSSPVLVKISPSSEPVMLTLMTASGDELAFQCSVVLREGRSTNAATWPTLEVVLQPVLVAINLTRIPLAIRSNTMEHKTLEPGSYPTPFSLDIKSSKNVDDVEAVLNQASIQIADMSCHSEGKDILWSSPLQNLVRYSGAMWSIPQSASPLADEINAFRRLGGTDESGENVNFKAPIIVEFLVERGEHGCFRVFFRGGDGASLAKAPIMIKNHLHEPLLIRQVKANDFEDVEKTSMQKSTVRLLQGIKKASHGVGQSFAIRPFSAISWAWSVPGIPMRLDNLKKQELEANAAELAFRKRKFLEISNNRGDCVIIEINVFSSRFKGFMHLGDLRFRARGERTLEGTIIGEWRDGSFVIFVVDKTVTFDNFSFKTEIVNQAKASTLYARQQEKHIAVNLAGFSVTIIDRLCDSFVELFHLTIDDVMIRHGMNLINSSSVYNYLRIGALQIDFSTHDASYPVFVWHDPADGHLLEAYATLSMNSHIGGDSIDVYHVQLTTTKKGLVIRAGEDLVWTILNFGRLLQTQLPQHNNSAGSAVAPRATFVGKQTSQDSLLNIATLYVEPTSFVVTFAPNSDIRPADADARMIAALTFASLQRLHLVLNKFDKFDESILRSNLIREFRSYFKSQMIAQTLSVMTSMHTLTNVSTGLDAVSKAVETGFGVLAPSRTTPLARLPSSVVGRGSRSESQGNFAKSVFLGLKRLGVGISTGIIGLFVSPVKGCMEGGVVGGCKGCARGVADLVAKPTAGALALASKAVEGVANAAKGVQTAAWDIVTTNNVSKACIRRLPIAVRSDGVIRRWEARDALGVYCMRTCVVSSRTLGISYRPGEKDSFSSMHDIFGAYLLLVTDKRALCVQTPEMDGTMPARAPSCAWYISWSDVSSIWIEDSVIIKLQMNVTSEGDTSNLGAQRSETESCFSIRARAKDEAANIEAAMRQSWNAYLDTTQEE